MSVDNEDNTIFSNANHNVEHISKDSYCTEDVKNGLKIKQEADPSLDGSVANNNTIETKLEYSNEDEHCLVENPQEISISGSESSTDISSTSSPDLSHRNVALNNGSNTELVSNGESHDQNNISPALSTDENAHHTEEPKKNADGKDVRVETQKNVMNGHQENQNLPLENHVPYGSNSQISETISLEELTETLLSETSRPELRVNLRFSPSSSAASSPARSEPTRNYSMDLNGISGSIMNHPAYKMAMHDMLALKEQVGDLKHHIARLEEEKQLLEADRSPEIFQLQLETLEKTVGQQAREIEAAKVEAMKQEEAAVAALASAKIQLDRLKKHYAEADREREATVVRYAVSEREREKSRLEVQNLEKRLVESGRERDSLLIKLKTAAAEKSRACHALDTKCAELSSQTREMERLRDELNARDIKIKWAQNKVRSEIDAHKETQQKVDKLTVKLQEAREETEQVRKECQAVIKNHNQGKEDRTQALELQVQEQKAQLITERHARQDAEDARKVAVTEAEVARARQQQLLDENNALSLRVQQLEQERLGTEQRLSTFQSSEERRCQLEADIEALTLQLQQQENRAESSKAEIERLRQNSAELAQDAQSCREREAELLLYTQKLTDKVVRLQSESSALQARAQQVEAEREPLARRATELSTQLAQLETALAAEKAARLEESQLLARRLAEKQEWGERLAKQLEEAQGECAVLRRKQAQATKELTREVQQCRRKLMQAEGSSTGNLSQNSRSGSLNSLNSVEHHPAPTPSQVPDPAQGGLDPQLLIAHIGKLQRQAARQQEKIDFLEEHTRTLLGEVQRKARLVQGLVMRDEAGALSSRASDRNKAELSKHGGVMASLYNAVPADESMTLELSLEINRKLQAVLEDTLLKNITLKDNMDTLGQEIERLSAQLSAAKKSKSH